MTMAPGATRWNLVFGLKRVAKTGTLGYYELRYDYHGVQYLWTSQTAVEVVSAPSCGYGAVLFCLCQGAARPRVFDLVACWAEILRSTDAGVRFAVDPIPAGSGGYAAVACGSTEACVAVGTRGPAG